MNEVEIVKIPRRQIGIRFLYTLLYLVVLEVLKLLVQVAVVLQFIYLLITGRYSEPLRISPTNSRLISIGWSATPPSTKTSGHFRSTSCRQRWKNRKNGFTSTDELSPHLGRRLPPNPGQAGLTSARGSGPGRQGDEAGVIVQELEADVPAVSGATDPGDPAIQ